MLTVLELTSKKYQQLECKRYGSGGSRERVGHTCYLTSEMQVSVQRRSAFGAHRQRRSENGMSAFVRAYPRESSRGDSKVKKKQLKRKEEEAGPGQ